MFEDPEWRAYFWAPLPSDTPISAGAPPMASILMTVLSDLVSTNNLVYHLIARVFQLFCPDFTVAPLATVIKSENTEKLNNVDSCELIWQSGIGFTNKTTINATYDSNRTEILKLLLTCFSEVIYVPVEGSETFKYQTTFLVDENRMRWIRRFTSAENKHVLPLFTSLLNVICCYDPVGYGLPYNYLLMSDCREPLVQASLHLLIVCLDRDAQSNMDESGYVDNFFVNYLSRIHRVRYLHT